MDMKFEVDVPKWKNENVVFEHLPKTFASNPLISSLHVGFFFVNIMVQSIYKSNPIWRHNEFPKGNKSLELISWIILLSCYKFNEDLP
jgi:hypothetical protein